MTTLLAEQPLLVSIMLAALAAGLIFGWLQTGKTAAAVAGLVLVLLIPLAWVIAAYWVTDREQIESLIRETAEAVENNDYDRVYSVIGDPSTETQARAELPQYEFDEARVTGIRSLEFIQGSYPPEADVDLNVRVSVSHRGGRFADVRVPRRLILRLQQTDDRWRVVDYRHMPVVGGPDAFSTAPQR
jgi:ketosteroid isomerase-like protein